MALARPQSPEALVLVERLPLLRVRVRALASTGPYVYAIVPFLGFANGWIYPAQRNLLVALIPGGCEAEMYAFGVLRGAAHTPSTRDSRAGWASSSSVPCRSRGRRPGLPRHGRVDGDYRLAILVCPIFWLGGLAVLYFCVDVDKGLAEVEATLIAAFKSAPVGYPLRHFAYGARPA